MYYFVFKSNRITYICKSTDFKSACNLFAKAMNENVKDADNSASVVSLDKTGRYYVSGYSDEQITVDGIQL